jgi:hypothetical protein
MTLYSSCDWLVVKCAREMHLAHSVGSAKLDALAHLPRGRRRKLKNAEKLATLRLSALRLSQRIDFCFLPQRLCVSTLH